MSEKCLICGKDDIKSEKGLKIHMTKMHAVHDEHVHKTYAPDIATFSYNSVQRVDAISDMETYQKLYQQVEWARAAVDYIQRVYITSGYRIAVKEGAEVDTSVLQTINEFFEQPNEEDHMEDILIDTLIDLLVFGNAYWEIKVEAAKLPRFLKMLRDGKVDDPYDVEFPFKIYVINGRTMEIDHDDNGVTQYKQRSGSGEYIYFNPSEILHFKLPGAGNDIYGLSPMLTLQNSLASDLLATDYNAKFFENDATPKLHIDLGNVPPDELQAFVARVQRKLRGNPHQNLVTTGGVTVDKISFNNKDMEFDTYLTRLMNRVCAVYGVPPSLLGLKNSDDLVEESILFSNFTVKPLQKLVARRINRKLMKWLFRGIPVSFVFKPITPVDAQRQADADNTDLKGAVKTVNEVRASRGMNPVSWGDEVIIPWSDASQAILPGTETNKPKEEEKPKKEDKEKEEENEDKGTD